MSTARDMTKAQFDAACRKHGFKPVGFLGYYELPLEGRCCNVSVLNAGKRRRAQLAYLLQQLEIERRRVAP